MANKQDIKPCNCKKSNCLKLYCECFANGSYCCPTKCNCVQCFNNFECEAERNKAIFATLERNPNAFRSKIVVKDTVAHNKGCHCKRSSCLKKYCECFQGKIPCSDKCRCFDCRNFAGSPERARMLHALELAGSHSSSMGSTAPGSDSGQYLVPGNEDGQVPVGIGGSTDEHVHDTSPPIDSTAVDVITRIGDCISDESITLACRSMLAAVCPLLPPANQSSSSSSNDRKRPIPDGDDDKQNKMREKKVLVSFVESLITILSHSLLEQIGPNPELRAKFCAAPSSSARDDSTTTDVDDNGQPPLKSVKVEEAIEVSEVKEFEGFGLFRSLSTLSCAGTNKAPDQSTGSQESILSLPPLDVMFDSQDS